MPTEKTSHEKGPEGGPWALLGPLGGPRGPLGAPGSPLGPPWVPLGPWGPKSDEMGANNFKTLPENKFLYIFGPKIKEKKLGFRPRDPHGEIRAGILRRIPVSRSQMVGWRPIWWQKGVNWGPWLAHLWAGSESPLPRGCQTPTCTASPGPPWRESKRTRTYLACLMTPRSRRTFQPELSILG